MRRRDVILSLAASPFALSGCGGESASPPSPPGPPSPPAPPPSPPPPPPPPGFFDGVTHFDGFERPDTPPGTISNGPQGQVYELYADLELAPDPFGRLAGGSFVMPPPNQKAASYALNAVSGQVRRFGTIVEYSANTGANRGANGYVWALMLSHTRQRFFAHMIHLSGTHLGWSLEIWYPDSSRRTIAQAPLNLPYGVPVVVDVKLQGSLAAVTVASVTTQVGESDLAAFADARFLLLEHFALGPSQNINRFPAWYYEVDGAPLADPRFYESEPGIG